MADYSHLNLKDDVENMSERFGLAPQMEARFARSALGLQGGGFSYQKLAPDLEGPFGHRHRTQEEAYVVVSGSGRIKLEDEVRELKQWDVIRVPPATARAFAAGPDGLELLAIGFGEGGDAELIEKPWGGA
ncbi:MAG TPA: cupin domain-containing protein [Gaiellaceae bacterium]|nr:cupin domain-containing protein [Gaiellaceae bacterium]